jgi:hypothetical protein
MIPNKIKIPDFVPAPLSLIIRGNALSSDNTIPITADSSASGRGCTPAAAIIGISGIIGASVPGGAIAGLRNALKINVNKLATISSSRIFSAAKAVEFIPKASIQANAKAATSAILPIAPENAGIESSNLIV